jgi:hypothetical protein
MAKFSKQERAPRGDQVRDPLWERLREAIHGQLGGAGYKGLIRELKAAPGFKDIPDHDIMIKSLLDVDFLKKHLTSHTHPNLTFLRAYAEAKEESLIDFLKKGDAGAARSEQNRAQPWRIDQETEDYSRSLNEAVTKSTRKELTILYGRLPALRLIPRDIYESLHKRVFEPLGSKLAAKRKKQLDDLKGEVEELFPADNRNRRKQFPRLDHLMLRSHFENLILGRFLMPDEAAQFLEHVQEWEDDGACHFYLIDDLDLHKERHGTKRLQLEAWETIAAVGRNLAIRRALDYSFVWSEHPASAAETYHLLVDLREKLAYRAALGAYRSLVESRATAKPSSLPSSDRLGS